MRMGELLTLEAANSGQPKLIRDAEISTTCGECGTVQTLSEAGLRLLGDDAEYVCAGPGCREVVAAVRKGEGTGVYAIETGEAGLDVTPTAPPVS
jgi:hypothetical protein